VIGEGVFPVEPWCVRETSLNLDTLAQSESLFALSNGHVGLRGNLDEGEPHAILGSYLSGFYEQRPLPYAEGGYGYPEDGQSLVNVTNGKLIRLLVEDEPLDLRYGTLRSHERTLDLRAGTLERRFEWVSPAGVAIRVRTTRLVSFVHRAVAAICYEVEAVDRPVRLILQSELVANEDQADVSGDPRRGEVLKQRSRPCCRTTSGRALCSSTAPAEAACSSPPAWTTWWTRLTLSWSRTCATTGPARAWRAPWSPASRCGC
jgi:alpha,alpha-trehalose phosphorylase